MVAQLLQRESAPDRRAAWAGAAIVAAASLKVTGLPPALVILLLGFANGNRVLAGFGVLALLAYLSQYYYSLEITLLEKSAVLIATGIALLVLRLLLQRLWPETARA